MPFTSSKPLRFAGRLVNRTQARRPAPIQQIALNFRDKSLGITLIIPVPESIRYENQVRGGSFCIMAFVIGL
jgi:hypothetical protein